jgi:hypothetical protein
MKDTGLDAARQNSVHSGNNPSKHAFSGIKSGYKPINTCASSS